MPSTVFALTVRQKQNLMQRWDQQLEYAEQIVRARSPFGLMHDFYAQAAPAQIAQMETWKNEDRHLINQWERENLDDALNTDVVDLTEEQWEILEHFGHARKITIEGERPDMDQWETAWVRL